MSAAPSRQPEIGCADMAPAVQALEQAVGDSQSQARLSALQRHAGACAACRARHGAVLARLAGLCALRSRDVPLRALDGLSAAVLARIRSGPAGAGMSPAFLDAPRSLTVWRRAAVAASVLLAVGAGLAVSGRIAWRGEAGARDPEVRDARDALLLRWNAPRRESSVAEDLDAQPVLLPARGQNDFWFLLPPAQPRPAADDSSE